MFDYFSPKKRDFSKCDFLTFLCQSCQPLPGAEIAGGGRDHHITETQKINLPKMLNKTIKNPNQTKTKQTNKKREKDSCKQNNVLNNFLPLSVLFTFCFLCKESNILQA